MRDFAGRRGWVEAERVAIVTHRLEFHRPHFCAAGIRYVAVRALEYAVSIRRTQAFCIEVFEMIELQSRILLEIRGDHLALWREFAVGIPCREVDVELRMRA